MGFAHSAKGGVLLASLQTSLNRGHPLCQVQHGRDFVAHPRIIFENRRRVGMHLTMVVVGKHFTFLLIVV